MFAPFKKWFEPPAIHLSTHYGSANQAGRPGPVMLVIVEHSHRQQTQRPLKNSKLGGRSIMRSATATGVAAAITSTNSSKSSLLQNGSAQQFGVLVATPRAVDRYCLNGMPTRRIAFPYPVTALCYATVAGVGRVFVSATQDGKIYIMKADFMDSMIILDTKDSSSPVLCKQPSWTGGTPSSSDNKLPDPSPLTRRTKTSTSIFSRDFLNNQSPKAVGRSSSTSPVRRVRKSPLSGNRMLPSGYDSDDPTSTTNERSFACDDNGTTMSSLVGDNKSLDERRKPQLSPFPVRMSKNYEDDGLHTESARKSKSVILASGRGRHCSQDSHSAARRIFCSMTRNSAQGQHKEKSSESDSKKSQRVLSPSREQTETIALTTPVTKFKSEDNCTPQGLSSLESPNHFTASVLQDSPEAHQALIASPKGTTPAPISAANIVTAGSISDTSNGHFSKNPNVRINQCWDDTQDSHDSKNGYRHNDNYDASNPQSDGTETLWSRQTDTDSSRPHYLSPWLPSASFEEVNITPSAAPQLSAEICTVAVQLSFANVARAVIAGNVQGQVYIWKVPSGRLVDVIPCPFHKGERKRTELDVAWRKSSSRSRMSSEIVSNSLGEEFAENGTQKDLSSFSSDPSLFYVGGLAVVYKGAQFAENDELWIGYGNGSLAVYDMELRLIKLVFGLPDNHPALAIEVSSLMNVAFVMGGNSEISAWSVDNYSLLRVFPTTAITCGKPLSCLKIKEHVSGVSGSRNWKGDPIASVKRRISQHDRSVSCILFAGCVDGSVVARRIFWKESRDSVCDEATHNPSPFLPNPQMELEAQSSMLKASTNQSISFSPSNYRADDSRNDTIGRANTLKDFNPYIAARGGNIQEHFSFNSFSSTISVVPCNTQTLACELLRTFAKETEPACPVTNIVVDEELDSLFVGDASGVVSTIVPIRNLLDASQGYEMHIVNTGPKKHCDSVVSNSIGTYRTPFSKRMFSPSRKAAPPA